jgi:hypothetical protein
MGGLGPSSEAKFLPLTDKVRARQALGRWRHLARADSNGG